MTPTDPNARTERVSVIEALDQYAEAVAIEELRRANVSADWATENVRFAISAGVPVTELTPLIRICDELNFENSPTAALDGLGNGGEPRAIAEGLRQLPFARWLAEARSAPLRSWAKPRATCRWRHWTLKDGSRC